jgi:acetyltransferase-like isoleucine patch superfamily enzyme
VNLKAGTIVGAGSVVTKSFEEGDVVVAGNPAKIVRKKYQTHDFK